MPNSPWSIFPPIKASRVIDVLDAGSIAADGIEHIEKLAKRLLYGQTLQLVVEAAGPDLLGQCRQFVIESPELQFIVVKNMPVHLLIEPAFFDSFAKVNGRVYGLSVNVDVNYDNTVAFMNDKIVLSLNASTYHKLGLQGQPSTLNRKSQIIPKYRVELDLSLAAFKLGTKLYKRIYECLRRVDLKLDFAIKWEPSSLHNDKSPNSLEAYFRFCNQELKIERYCPSLRSYTNRSVPLLTTKLDANDKTNINRLLNECIDWCEAQAAEVNCNSEQIDSEVSSFALDTTDDWKTSGDVYCIQLKGFFTAANVLKLRRHLRPLLDRSEHAALIVHSFTDVPQCWSGESKQHYKDLGGDALYGLGQFNGRVISWAIGDRFDFGVETL